MTPKHYFEPERVTELEIKISYLEHQLDQLDNVVIAQAARIDRLQAQLEQFTYQQRQSNPSTFRSLRDEIPPHY
ncbi:MAG: SlyX family protein [Rhodoferax sp.]